MNYKLLLIATGLLLFTTTAWSSDDGAELFAQSCSSCHFVTEKATLAPPIFAVVRYVKGAYPDQELFVERIVDWVENPQAEDALMQGAVKKFGLMPKLSIKTEDLEKIAIYLYKHKFNVPDWYKKHYKEKHGRDVPE